MRILSIILCIISSVILVILTTSHFWNVPTLTNDSKDILRLSFDFVIVVNFFLIDYLKKRRK